MSVFSAGNEPATAQDVEQAHLLGSIEEAEKILGTGKTYDEKHMLQCYEAVHWAKIENDEKGDLIKIINAKNILLRHLVEGMIGTTGRFDLVIPFENICKECVGTGELYKFFRKPIEVDCRFCDGKGKKLVKCKSCDGTSRFKKVERGLSINVACKTCKGKNIIDDISMIELKCKKCRGKGKVRKIALDNKIKATTPCRPCKGRGFFHPKKEKEPVNPVLSTGLGEQIKNTIVDTE